MTETCRLKPLKTDVGSSDDSVRTLSGLSGARRAGARKKETAVISEALERPVLGLAAFIPGNQTGTTQYMTALG